MRWNGLTETLDGLESIPEEMPGRVYRLVGRVTTVAAREVRRAAPKGKIRKGVKRSLTGRGLEAVGRVSLIFPAVFAEGGTKTHAVAPRKRKALKIPGSESGFAMHATVRGQRATPFLATGADRAEGGIEEAAAQMLDDVMKSVARRRSR